MTSFLVKEAIQFAKEKGSKVNTCFLDVRKAFDQVWHNGLFYKLYNCGINRTILKVIMNLYTDMESCVKTQAHKSAGFPVSPFLYLVYDNDLMWQLEESHLGLCVCNLLTAVAQEWLMIN